MPADSLQHPQPQQVLQQMPQGFWVIRCGSWVMVIFMP